MMQVLGVATLLCPYVATLAEPMVYGASQEEQHTTTFFELAAERFTVRAGRRPTPADEAIVLKDMQFLRVPKAGSSTASVLARRLGGCTPPGPCCNYFLDPRGSCPADGLMCPEVTGCTGHRVDKDKLLDPLVFSMSNLRDVVDRMVSGFFYGGGHAPQCSRKGVKDYERCFTAMITDTRYQNVVSKMFTGVHPYASQPRMCLKRAPTGGPCSADLESAVRGACNLNYIMICESGGSSLLLLFETLPWLGPTHDDFSRLDFSEDNPRGASFQAEARKNMGVEHDEGIKHITPALRERASRANAVDLAVHEFVSAKFCDRLAQVGLLEHPLVAEDLSSSSLMHQRCNNASWVATTLEIFDPMVPENCRLFEPVDRPAN